MRGFLRGRGLKCSTETGLPSVCLVVGGFDEEQGTGTCYEEVKNYLTCLEHWGFSHIRTMVIDFSFFF